MKVRTYRNDIGLFCTDEYDPILDEPEYFSYIEDEEDDAWYYVGQGTGYLLNGQWVEDPDKYLEDDYYPEDGRDYSDYDDDDDYLDYFNYPSYFETYPGESRSRSIICHTIGSTSGLRSLSVIVCGDAVIRR